MDSVGLNPVTQLGYVTTCATFFWGPTFSLGFLGGGFEDFLFSPLFGEDSHFD